jgi:hypothetical protein
VSQENKMKKIINPILGYDFKRNTSLMVMRACSYCTILNIGRPGYYSTDRTCCLNRGLHKTQGIRVCLKIKRQ